VAVTVNARLRAPNALLINPVAVVIRTAQRTPSVSTNGRNVRTGNRDNDLSMRPAARTVKHLRPGAGVSAPPFTRPIPGNASQTTRGTRGGNSSLRIRPRRKRRAPRVAVTVMRVTRDTAKPLVVLGEVLPCLPIPDLTCKDAPQSFQVTSQPPPPLH